LQVRALPRSPRPPKPEREVPCQPIHGKLDSWIKLSHGVLTPNRWKNAVAKGAKRLRI